MATKLNKEIAEPGLSTAPAQGFQIVFGTMIKQSDQTALRDNLHERPRLTLRKENRGAAHLKRVAGQSSEANPWTVNLTDHLANSTGRGHVLTVPTVSFGMHLLAASSRKEHATTVIALSSTQQAQRINCQLPEMINRKLPVQSQQPKPKPKRDPKWQQRQQ